MRIMFTTTEPPYPDVVMGGQLDVHGLASHLAKRGHRCVIAGGSLPQNYDSFWPRVDRKLDRMLDGNPLFDAAQRMRSKLGTTLCSWEREEYSGYSIYRMPRRYALGMMPKVLAAERPDITFTQGHQREQLALLAKSRGVPSIIRVVCAEDVDWVEAMARKLSELQRLISAGETLIVSNSEFVATCVLKQLNVQSPVIYPLVSLDECISAEHHAEFVTFINPIPQKGVDLAVRIAALLPHRKFCFVESWRLDPKPRRALEAQLAGLPNVQLTPATSDIRTIYRSTALLMAPSQVEEAFGRVVFEACANGIPVVGSDIGGIPEAVGQGGLLLPATDPAERWAQAIESVLGNQALYHRLGSAGAAHARQAQFDADTTVTTFAQLAASFVARQTT
jgi:glycosyltransferase involved in cell wall biosynthesis